MEIEAHAGEDQPEVPRGRVIRARFSFPRPDEDAVRRMFEVAHRQAEILRHESGGWRSPGEFDANARWPAYLVLGYLHGWRFFGEDAYRRRADEGLRHLLQAQRPDGHFPWFHRSYGGVSGEDCQFDTGIAGRAFAEAYRETGEERYLHASRRAAEWLMALPISENNNYNMFGVWHLAELYRLTGEKRFLESAIPKTREGGFPRQMPSGGWPGHNSWIWYHGIILRGMAALHSVLPAGHPFRDELLGPMTAAANRAIRDQLASGEIPPNPGLEEGMADSYILNALLFTREAYRISSSPTQIERPELVEGCEAGDRILRQAQDAKLTAGETDRVLENCISGLVALHCSRLPSDTDLEDIKRRWRAHLSATRQAESAATGEVVWLAPICGWRTDPVWGKIPDGWFNCWYPCNDFDPAHVRWRRTGDAIELRATGSKLFGGVGCAVPQGTLKSGRRYLMRAKLMAAEEPPGLGKTRVAHASVYSGPPRPTWDPFTGCEFVKENPPVGDFGEIRAPFIAGDEDHYLYVWLQTDALAPEESVSLLVKGVEVADDGLPRPVWEGPFTGHNHAMALYNAALILESGLCRS